MDTLERQLKTGPVICVVINSDEPHILYTVF